MTRRSALTALWGAAGALVAPWVAAWLVVRLRQSSRIHVNLGRLNR